MKTLAILLLIGAMALSFSAGEAFAFDPQVFDMTLNDVQTQQFDGYDIVTIDFNLFNNGSEDIVLSGYSSIYLNDTNADYWEPINHRDFGFTETECPALDTIALVNSTTNIKLCFLTTNEVDLGYSLVIEDDDYFTEHSPKEFQLESVPDWFKTTAASWCSDAITESQFITLTQTNIEEGAINVLRTQSGLDLGAQTPDWVKNNTCLWSTDQLSDYEFLDSIYWFVDNGKIQLN
jgi:hypothetical protein